MIKKKTAKEIIAESFQELARDKNVNKITIKDIVQNCGYSSATFYREFKDKYDLISWLHSYHVEKILSQIGSGYRWNQTLFEGANFYQDNKAYYINLLENTSGYDAFGKSMTDIHYNNLKKCVQRYASEIKPIEHLDYYILIYCMGTVKFCCDWLLGKIVATPREVSVIWEKSLPAPLSPYLYNY